MLANGFRRASSKVSPLAGGAQAALPVETTNLIREAARRGVEKVAAGKKLDPNLLNAVVNEASEQAIKAGTRFGRTKATAAALAKIMTAGGIEGGEEFMAGLAGAYAIAGMDEQGNFSLDNVTPEEKERVFQQAAKEGALGLVLGLGLSLF